MTNFLAEYEKKRELTRTPEGQAVLMSEYCGVLTFKPQELIDASDVLYRAELLDQLEAAAFLAERGGCFGRAVHHYLLAGDYEQARRAAHAGGDELGENLRDSLEELLPTLK